MTLPASFGAIINLLSGGENAERFRNRKGYFSINVQTVSDAGLRIQNIVARWPGSVHDSTIFDNSRIKAFMETRYDGCFILGDSGYPVQNYLMTPLANPLTVAENLYNESLIRTRNVVERSYGVWKRRFPCLSMGLRVKLDTALNIIVATAVLHNLACNLAIVEFGDDFVDPEWNNEPYVGNQRDRMRRHLIENYFANLV